MSMSITTSDSTPCTRLPQLVVMISGSGTNLQALIDAIYHTPSSPLYQKCEIRLVVSNRSSAYGIIRAQQVNIPTLTFPYKPYRDRGDSREQYDHALALTMINTLNGNLPDLIVLAGWMHILSPSWLQSFPSNRVINLHPALPGQFDGANAIKRAYEASIVHSSTGINETGCMVHYVIDQVDQGDVILTRKVPILSTDSLMDLEKRIHSIEHELLVEAVIKILIERGLLLQS